MAQFDALTKAKKAAEQAAQAAKEMKENAAAKAEQASSRMGDWKERLADKVGEIKDTAIAGIKDLTDDLNRRLPALREAGYTLTHVAIEIGLSPKLKATFSAAPDISQERVDAIIEEHKDAKLTVALLRALYGAYKVQSSIRIAGMTPLDIELELGLMPVAIVRFA
jgi:hypothetical protein